MTEVLTQEAPTESEGLSLDRASNRKPMMLMLLKPLSRIARRLWALPPLKKA